MLENAYIFFLLCEFKIWTKQKNMNEHILKWKIDLRVYFKINAFFYFFPFVFKRVKLIVCGSIIIFELKFEFEELRWWCERFRRWHIEKTIPYNVFYVCVCACEDVMIIILDINGKYTKLL